MGDMSHIQKYKMLWTRTSFVKNIADIMVTVKWSLHLIKNVTGKLLKGVCVRITKCDKKLLASYQKVKEINY